MYLNNDIKNEERGGGRAIKIKLMFASKNEF